MIDLRYVIHFACSFVTKKNSTLRFIVTKLGEISLIELSNTIVEKHEEFFDRKTLRTEPDRRPRATWPASTITSA